MTKIQLRRDTAANWSAINSILSPGEIGFATDTKDFKFGDGATAWNALTPWSPNTVNGSSKLVAIGNNGFGTSLLANATSTAGTSERMFTVGVAATNVKVLWRHSYVQVASQPFTDTDPGGSITFSASLRVVSSTNPGTVTNTLYRLTFGGRTSVTLDPGGYTTCDFLGLALAPGDVVAVRTYLSSGTAYAPTNTWGSGGSSMGLGGFVATTDLTAPGSGSVTTAAGYFYGPSALLGQAQSPGTASSVLLIGDSIGAATGDYAMYTSSAYPDGGMALRALTGKAGLINTSVGGDLGSWFQSTDGSFRRLSVAGFCTSAMVEYGGNDIYAVAGTALATQAILLNLANTLRRLGITKIFVNTFSPRTTSTDGWATTVNQTITDPTGGNAQRVAHNTWVRANCPINPSTKAPVAVGTSGALLAGSFGHPLTGFFDTAATVESSLNSGLWLPATRVATGSITSGTNVLTSSTANFLSANQENGGDKGSRIILFGAGAAGGLFEPNIGVVSSSTQVLVDGIAATTVTNAVLNIGIMTADGAHPSPRGYYLMSQAINPALL